MTLIDRAVSFVLPAIPKPIVGHFSKRYIAGETVDDAFEAVRGLLREGAMTTLDILGEFITTVEEARVNAQAYETLIRRIHKDELPDTNVSIKLTAFGLNVTLLLA